MNVIEEDGARVRATDHQLRRSDGKVQRPAEGRAAKKGHAFARDEPERCHALAGHPGGVDGGDRPGMIRRQAIEGEVHGRWFLLMILIIPSLPAGRGVDDVDP